GPRPRARRGTAAPLPLRRGPRVPAQPDRKRLPGDARARGLQRARAAHRRQVLPHRGIADSILSRNNARPVRRAALLLALPAALTAASASAREQAGCAQASAAKGPAPLAVTFTASCAAASYHWDFGDGTAADGPSVGHTFGAGRFAVTLTSTQADGSAASERLRIDSLGLTLSAPRSGRYARPVLLRGRLVPSERGRVRLYRAGKL